MTQTYIDQAIESIKGQRFGHALDLLRLVIDQEPSHWNAWYMAGQCCRFLNNIDGAIKYLSRAAELKRDEPSIFLALGIAFQLNNQLDNAIDALCRAIEIDPDYELAYNSLAMTFSKRGELDKGLSACDAGLYALSRQIIKAMINSRSSSILSYSEASDALWPEYAMNAALYQACSAEGIKGVAWPTGELALDEERSEKHAGLYWTDVLNEKKETLRLFLPNYFNTFQELLKRDASYSNLIGNRGTVLELLGRHDEARRHFAEATKFQPRVVERH